MDSITTGIGAGGGTGAGASSGVVSSGVVSAVGSSSKISSFTSAEATFGFSVNPGVFLRVVAIVVVIFLVFYPSGE
jgi:hypothetical protein